MKATIDLEKVYDQVIYNVFSKIDGAEDLQKLIKTRNMDQLASMGATNGWWVGRENHDKQHGIKTEEVARDSNILNVLE